MTEETELAALERNLRTATAKHKDAVEAESIARSEETTARNNLNAAQRQLDAYLKKLRDAAPRESDWGSEKTHKFAVRTA